MSFQEKCTLGFSLKCPLLSSSCVLASTVCTCAIHVFRLAIDWLCYTLNKPNSPLDRQITAREHFQWQKEEIKCFLKKIKTTEWQTKIKLWANIWFSLPGGFRPRRPWKPSATDSDVFCGRTNQQFGKQQDSENMLKWKTQTLLMCLQYLDTFQTLVVPTVQAAEKLKLHTLSALQQWHECSGTRRVWPVQNSAGRYPTCRCRTRREPVATLRSAWPSRRDAPTRQQNQGQDSRNLWRILNAAGRLQCAHLFLVAWFCKWKPQLNTN